MAKEQGRKVQRDDGVIAYDAIPVVGTARHIDEELLAKLVEEPNKVRTGLFDAKLIGQYDGVGYGNMGVRIPDQYTGGRLEMIVTQSQTGDTRELAPEQWIRVTKCEPGLNNVFYVPQKEREGAKPSSETMTLYTVLAATGAPVAIHVHSRTMWELSIEADEWRSSPLVARFANEIGEIKNNVRTAARMGPADYVNPVKWLTAGLALGKDIQAHWRWDLYSSKVGFDIPVVPEYAGNGTPVEFGTPEMAKETDALIRRMALDRSRFYKKILAQPLLQSPIMQPLLHLLDFPPYVDYSSSGIIAMGGHPEGMIAYGRTVREAARLVLYYQRKAEMVELNRGRLKLTPATM